MLNNGKLYYTESYRVSVDGEKTELGFDFYIDSGDVEVPNLAFFPVTLTSFINDESGDAEITMRASELNKMLDWVAYSTKRFEYGGRKFKHPCDGTENNV